MILNSLRAVTIAGLPTPWAVRVRSVGGLKKIEGENAARQELRVMVERIDPIKSSELRTIQY